MNDDDRQRFVRGLFLFNDRNAAPNAITQTKQAEDAQRPRDLLIHLHAWCLMDNHYHLLLSAVDDDLRNLSLFMQKLNMGYSKFFNEKYERTGALWQGKYKKVHIVRGAHFLYIPYYIHLNALDRSFPKWREGNVTRLAHALKALRGYRWSSYLDYQKVRNFPSVIDDGEVKQILGSQKQQETVVREIISNPDKAAHDQDVWQT